MTNKNRKKTARKPGLSVTLGSNSNQKNRNSLIGKLVSINQKVTTYFGVGDNPGGFWLSPEEYCAAVPDGLSDKDYAIIDYALSIGKLVEGDVFIPPIDKPSDVPEEYWLAIKDTGFNKTEARDKFSSLLRRGVDRGYTAIELAEYCYERESNYKKRNGVLRLLKQVMDNYDGPVRLYTPPDKGTSIDKVKISSDGTVTVTDKAGNTVTKNTEPEAPAEHVPGGKPSKEVLDEFID